MIDKIFNGSYLRRLDNTIQWQEKDTLSNDSVSSHSFKVAVFARVLLEDVFGSQQNDSNVIDFKLEVVTAALFHDFDEAMLMRDISHELKYNEFNGDKIRESLNEYVKYAIERDFILNNNPSNPNYKDSANMVVNSIVNEKDVVKVFVKYCDWLAMLFYCRRELDLNNSKFMSLYDYCEKRTHETGEHLKDVLKINFPKISLNLDCIM